MLVCSLLCQERGSRRTGRGGQREENRNRHSFLHQVVTLSASLSLYFYFVRPLFSLITVAFYFFVKNAHLTIRVFAQEVMEKVTFGDLANMAIKDVQD